MRRARRHGRLAGRRADLVLVVFAVEEMRVGPGAAALEQVAAGRGEVVLAQIARHLLRRAQRAQVPALHLRVGAEVLHVHRVVLAALHHPVPVGVPPARDPAELERLLRLRPQHPQHRVVAGQLPVAVQLHQAAHLTVGRGQGEFLGPLDGQVDAEAHQPVVAGGLGILDLAHGLGQIAEQEGGGLLVIPHVRARAVAAAGLVAAALPAQQASVRGAERGLRAQRAQVEQGRLLDDFGQVRLAKCAHELDRLRFERRQVAARYASTTSHASR